MSVPLSKQQKLENVQQNSNSEQIQRIQDSKNFSSTELLGIIDSMNLDSNIKPRNAKQPRFIDNPKTIDSKPVPNMSLHEACNLNNFPDDNQDQNLFDDQDQNQDQDQDQDQERERERETERDRRDGTCPLFLH